MIFIAGMHRNLFLSSLLSIAQNGEKDNSHDCFAFHHGNCLYPILAQQIQARKVRR